MNKRLLRMWSSILLAVTLVVAAGCQAIGKVDLNKAILSMLEVQSFEGSSSLTVEFQFNDQEPDAINADELAILKQLSPLKLNLDTVKQEDPQRVSLAGSIEVKRGKIPFVASITPEELVFKPEGAANPFVLKLNELAAGPAYNAAEQDQLTKNLEAKLKNPEFLKPVYSYLVNGLPNPKNINLSNVNETINGENVSLYKVETKLNGTEILPWVKSYLVKLMQDDQGLKAVIAYLYDELKPIFEEAAKAQESEVPLEEGVVAFSGVPFAHTIGSLLEDRETAIEVLHTEVKQGLVVLLAALNQPSENPDSPAALLNENTSVKNNIYVDHSMKVRKSETEILLSLPESFAASTGFSAVKVTSVSTNWNVNEDVKADIIPSAGAYELNHFTQPDEVLKQLDSSSTLYQVLKNDLHITRKTVYFWTENNEYLPQSMRTYSENGTTMAPARYLAERLGATVDWDGASQNVTITGKETGTVITATVGSASATVNGKTVELETPAAIKEGSVYVPLRFVSEALGAKVEWDADLGLILVTID